VGCKIGGKRRHTEFSMGDKDREDSFSQSDTLSKSARQKETKRVLFLHSVPGRWKKGDGGEPKGVIHQQSYQYGVLGKGIDR